MFRRLIAAASAVVVLSGCYHVTVITGAPEGSTVVEKPWQNSFVYGIVPPPEVNVSQDCPQSVAKVETQISFLNGVVGAVTYSIYTPMHVKVTCASGPVRR